MRLVRAVLAAFFGALGWFIWTTSHQSTGACYAGSHYVPSAAVALVAITAVVVASLRPWLPGRSASLIARAVVAAAMFSAIGLLVAGWFAAVISCSGG